MANVVAIKCPSCNGSGVSSLGKCLWCDGKKRLRRSDAIRWANQSITLGSGGYICGDHDWSDRCRMVNEGNAVREMLGLERVRA